MKNITIVKKNITKIKLTIAKEEIRIKFPINTSDNDYKRILPILLKISNVVSNYPYTLRTHFEKDHDFNKPLVLFACNKLHKITVINYNENICS